MRVVLQRVSNAKVTVAGETIGEIQEGLLALVGITHEDSIDQVTKLARKTWELRILADETSCSERNAPILAVSQFTLYADCKKGRRPSWNKAAPAEISEPLFNAYVAELQKLGAQVETGQFGAKMQVSLVNEGPVTIILEA